MSHPAAPEPADAEPGSAPVAALRARIRAARSALPAEVVAERSVAAMQRVTELRWWGDVRHLAVYRSFGGEVDPTPLVATAAGAGVTTYVPRLADGRLQFARFDASTQWTANRYGILEPDDTEVVEARLLDLVIVPAVAVDRRGNRLGMGAGWYDRTFSWLTATERPAEVVLVGAVHDEQVVDHLEAAPWDVGVDAVVTPTRSFVVG